MNIIEEYNKILVRDLGFSDYKDWMPMITKITDTLGIESMEGIKLTKAKVNPGKDIVKKLIQSWLNPRGFIWGKLFYISETKKFTPYKDYLEYEIHIRKVSELIGIMTGTEVYENYESLKRLSEDPNYKTLRQLDGVKVIIQ